ncbi:MAG: fumarylacetoacetate hydrolase family protein, partial [Saprospiraceae bacterium]|nr:fumarylacetoacetate hydrolase family protein [Saprospiraceae bacterium]
SGTDITRPKGQVKPLGQNNPTFGPTARLDFELEMALVVGKATVRGTSVSTTEAEDYIFGLVLFNDWSARDIQKWEYAPLGPFLGKSFASSISPWIIPLEALELFRVPGPRQTPKVLPYLQYEGDRNYDIQLEVSLQTQGGEEQIVSQSNCKYMYWNMVQQLAHHTVNGCNLNVGDLMASGTISGKTKKSLGSLLEITKGGTVPLQLDGDTRIFLEDYDTVVMRGKAVKNRIRVGFGEVKGQILPATLF